jgi:hypothetical protein
MNQIFHFSNKVKVVASYITIKIDIYASFSTSNYQPINKHDNHNTFACNDAYNNNK